MKPGRHEQDVATCAKLYECRRAAMFILGDKFHVTIRPWREAIEAHMQAKQRTVFQSVIDMARLIPESDGAALMLLMAAAVDLIESGGRPVRTAAAS